MALSRTANGLLMASFPNGPLAPAVQRRKRCYNSRVLQFRILGPLEVEDETGLVALGGRQQRALLGLLLIRAGEVVSTDQLIDQLWNEDPPQAARRRLQNLVAQLRKLLGAGATRQAAARLRAARRRGRVRSRPLRAAGQ